MTTTITDWIVLWLIMNKQTTPSELYRHAITAVWLVIFLHQMDVPTYRLATTARDFNK